MSIWLAFGVFSFIMLMFSVIVDMAEKGSGMMRSNVPQIFSWVAIAAALTGLIALAVEVMANAR